MTDDKDRCPCDCSCHAEGHASKGQCPETVTEEEKAVEELGPGGEYVCGWCYTVCEGVE